MALREARAAWRRLIFYFVCVAIGVASIVTLRSAIRNFNEVITGDARAILTADVQIDTFRPWNKEALSSIHRLAHPPLVQGRLETMEAPTMIRPADPKKEGAMMVDLRGVEPPYPFYGQIKLAEGKTFGHDLLRERGILAARPILDRLNLKTSDYVKIGDLTFQIRGIIESEPSTGLGFRFGPRVLIERSAIEEAGLVGFGSRARRRILLKVPESKVERLVKDLRKDLKSKFIRVRSYRDSQENLDEQFTRAENFLSLTGMIILVLGGIGISSVTRVFIEQRKKSIAVLKCVGGTARKVTAAYLMQIMILGAAGSVVGIGLAKLAMYLISQYYAESLPANMNYSLQSSAVLQGLAVGVFVTILFSALPLLRIRHIKPNVLLRDEDQLARVRFDFLRWSVALLVLIGLILLTSWQAGSLRTGFYFLGGLLVTSGILYIAAALLIRVVRKFRQVSSFPVRHAISSLHRPGNQTRVIVMGVGLGIFFIVATYSLQMNLLQEIDLEKRSNMPNMYLIDIQTDQKEGVKNLIHTLAPADANLIPTIRARIYAINGKPVDLEKPEARKDRGRLGFEYTLTYRSTLDPTESIIAGKLWDRTPSSVPEISIEESLKGMMGLDLGGTITFDILGKKIDARVSSIRRIDWRNARTAFYVLFRPGSLEKAPQTFVAALNGPTSEKERSRFQRELVDRFPNITVIDVADILRSVRRILRNITLAVSFIGGFVLFSGALILIGSIAMTKYQRIYESAVLKTLGANTKIILRILTIEYGLLGSVSGILGSLAGFGLAYIVSHFLFEIPWTYTPAVHVIAILGTGIFVTLVGAVASLDVLTRKPLGILRTQ